MTGATREFSRFELYRSVEGADDFLAKTAFWAKDKLGSVEAGPMVAVPSLAEQTQDDLPYDLLVSLAPPRVKVFASTDLRLSILERRMPRDMNPNFNHVAAKLTARTPKLSRAARHEGSPIRPVSLFTGLARIGLKHDIPNQENVEIHCSSVQPVPDIDYPDSVVMGLGLDIAQPATAMLSEQANHCVTYLMNLTGGKKAAYPYTPAPLVIPFAVLPPDAQAKEKSEFVAKVEEMLPLRLVMGGFEHYTLS